MKGLATAAGIWVPKREVERKRWVQPRAKRFAGLKLRRQQDALGTALVNQQRHRVIGFGNQE